MGRGVATTVGAVIGDCAGSCVVGKRVKGDKIMVVGRLDNSIFGDCVGVSVIGNLVDGVSVSDISA